MIESLMYLAIAAAIYFLPAIVAYNKKKKNRGAVLVLNLFLGWTIIGWIIALVWAASND